MRRSVISTFAILLACSGAALATPYNFDGGWVQVEYWAGSSAPAVNEALLVLDFGSGNNYAFGYRWSGSATGWDMLSAIDAAGSLDVDATYWPAYLSYTVDALSYDGHSAVSDWTNTFLGYWGSDDGTNWTAQTDGVSGRALTNMDWDGWSVEYVANGYFPLNPPTTPVPEPATMTLLLFGGIALTRKRRTRP